ncbi:glucan endo-1,3-beta-glucosidase, basic vacuolar isoform-like [Juglans microcarpa x Juglans regia]|uniref:glucan endo-1,3-beta-glucosidase, basic vacuolar isoform-like n=1 Tax=Juglans microcarpa x Juglans regia TaxID=2249226 RepID=UPI001B7EF379|nr:glucan endo-1,3-beta-glucosidase, basic vacuolar isoform-like [Juglans microcarpa x Juglans regia]
MHNPSVFAREEVAMQTIYHLSRKLLSLCKTHGIGKMRIYSPYPEILQPLGDSNMELIVGVPKDTFQDLADPSAAADWVQMNVKSYSSNVKLKYIAVGNELDPTAQFVLPCDSFQRNKKNNSSNVKFKYISVGNEIDPTDGAAQFVLPVMQNIYKAIADAGLQNQIKVSTAVSTNLLGVFDPPSAAAFSDKARTFIEPIISFLVSTGAPLLANIYPYYRVKYNNQSLPFALFTATDVVVQVGKLGYRNLFDALMDALYYAIEKINAGSLEIVVSESGWPSAGGAVETIENAGTYYRNLVNHVKGGTPKRPGKAIETYLLGLFDENLKEKEVDRHFGLFFGNKTAKYSTSFT